MELRSYTLTFFLALILINLLFKEQYLKKDITRMDYFLIILSSLLMLFCHPFSIIIILSLNFYILCLWVLKKNNNSNLKKIFFLNTFVVIFFLFFYLRGVSHTPYWIKQLDLSFFTNYFLDIILLINNLAVLKFLILSEVLFIIIVVYVRK